MTLTRGLLRGAALTLIVSTLLGIPSQGNPLAESSPLRIEPISESDGKKFYDFHRSPVESSTSVFTRSPFKVYAAIADGIECNRMTEQWPMRIMMNINGKSRIFTNVHVTRGVEANHSLPEIVGSDNEYSILIRSTGKRMYEGFHQVSLTAKSLTSGQSKTIVAATFGGC